MKKIKLGLGLSAIIFFCGQIMYSYAQSETVPPVVITEIGIFEPSETEWIEIYNKGDLAVNLDGWKFFEDQTNHGLSVFRGEAALKSNEFAVITNKADAFLQKYPDYLGPIFDSSWGSLKEDGEEIGLKDNSGNFIELFTYPAPQNKMSISLERIDINAPASEPTNWASHPSLHSLGKYNEISLPTQLQLTEVAPPVEQPSPAPVAVAPIPAPVAVAPPAPPLAPPQTIIINQNPPNSPPKAIVQIQSGETIAENSTTINFDGRASFDPDGKELTFLWDMGDGTKETTANPPPHKYSKPGTYSTTLTVTDAAGAQDQMQQYIYVLNKQQKISAVVNSPSPAPALSVPIPVPFSIPSISSGMTFEIRGFLTLQPTGEFKLENFQPTAKVAAAKTSVAPKKASQKTPKPAKKTKAKLKTKSKKQLSFKNGDLSGNIKITEIMPNPSEDDEWIEILNAGTTAVNLGNWTLADSAKKSSPYRIPDTISLNPGDYAVFKKSATKISLNNNQDEIFLENFKEDLIDNITYEGASQKDNSYALINIERQETNTSNLVASAQAIQKNTDEVWEWIDEPTPGTGNPHFKKIQGSVTNILAGSFNLGEKNILFNEKTLDPLVAQAVLRDGTIISAQVRENKDGTYSLKKIEKINTDNIEEQNEKKPYWSWLIIAVIAAGAGTYLILYGRRLSGTIGFQINKSPPR